MHIDVRDLELAWAAGFFDGEGNIRWNKYNTTQNGTNKARTRAYGLIILSVAQVHREPLERFLAAVGGGKIYGPYSNKPGQPHYQFHAAGKAGIAAFDALRPFLSSIKRTQGDAAMVHHHEQQARPRIDKTGRKRGPYRKKAA